MTWYRFLFTTVMVMLLARPAGAGIFFNKHPKQSPAERVPTLIMTLKTSAEERKRSQAAQELREFDPGAYPEIVPTLIDALEHDAKASVRIEALHSLAKLRPVSQDAGMAIEQAVDHDASLRVRLQARTYIMQYRMAGYRSQRREDAPPASKPAQMRTTDEPPLASPVDDAPIKAQVPPTGAGKLAGPRGTPIAVPIPATTQSPSPLVPVKSPKLQTPPPSSPPASSPPPAQDGPDLSPPK
jgi:hypothetical protein